MFVQLIVIQKELEETSSKYTERISAKYREFDEYEMLLHEAKPTLDELPVLTAMKTNLELAIQEQQGKYRKDLEIMESNYNSKMLVRIT